MTAERGNVDDPDVGAAAEALATRLAGEKSVARSVSYWGAGSPPPLRSKDGRQALVLASLRGNEDQVLDAARDLSPGYTRDDAAITVSVGGFAEVFRQVNQQVEADLLRAELIAFPITLLLLVLVFRSVVAAGLPLVVGALAIVGTFLVLLIVSSLTDVSIFALNLTTGMGLGLAIDYSLFVVSRYPRGAPQRARAVRRRRPHGADRRARRSRSARSRSRLRSRRCSCSRSRSCGRSPTPASASRFLPASARWSCLPALLAVLGPTGSTRCALLRRRPEAGRRGHLAPHRHRA